MKSRTSRTRRGLRAAIWLATCGCAPSILDDCKTTEDCAQGICEEGYCVPRADAEGGGGQVTPGDAAGGHGGLPHDAAADVHPADARPADARPADARPADARPPDAGPADARPADAASPDLGSSRDALSVDGAHDGAASLPDGSEPDAAVGPPIVGVCGGDRDNFPLYADSGEPCITLDTAGLWSFEGNYSGHGGGGRALRMDPGDGLAPGTVTYVDSPFDRAASFLGSDDLWQGASVTSSVRNTGPMSIEAWVRLPATCTGGTVVSTLDECRADHVTSGWQVGIARQDDPLGFLLTLQLWDGVDPGSGGLLRFVFDQGIILTPEQWHHIAVVFEGPGQEPARVWGWADGFLLGELPRPHLGALDGGAWLHFGTWANCYQLALEMELDAVRILNRALTLDELSATVP